MFRTHPLERNLDPLCSGVSDNEFVSKQEIDDYLASVAEPKRTTLLKLRQTIRDLLP